MGSTEHQASLWLGASCRRAGIALYEGVAVGAAEIAGGAEHRHAVLPQIKSAEWIIARDPRQAISASQGCRINDDRLPSGELAHQFDHVLRSAWAIARFAIPQRNEESAAQALRQRRVEYPAIAAVVDTDAGRRGPKLFRHDENRAAGV